MIDRKTPAEDPITPEEVKNIARVLSRCYGNIGQAAITLNLSPGTIEILALKHKDIRRVLHYWRNTPRT